MLKGIDAGLPIGAGVGAEDGAGVLLVSIEFCGAMAVAVGVGVGVGVAPLRSAITRPGAEDGVGVVLDVGVGVGIVQKNPTVSMPM